MRHKPPRLRLSRIGHAIFPPCDMTIDGIAFISLSHARSSAKAAFRAKRRQAITTPPFPQTPRAAYDEQSASIGHHGYRTVSRFLFSARRGQATQQRRALLPRPASKYFYRQPAMAAFHSPRPRAPLADMPRKKDDASRCGMER